MTDNEFFKSDLVQDEVDQIQECYTELLKMSAGLKEFDPEQRLEHVEKTLELIAKQKVFYSRLALASHGIDPTDEGENEAKYVKDRIDLLSQQYSGGLNLMMILQTMEDKLQVWRKELRDAKS
tara:strand:+ start:5257 stop:5625 length:369 start_codon:yes stop_codon:yes gene_type:complete